MKISKVSLVASVAGFLALPLQAQTASPELQNKALELLQQTLSQQPSQPVHQPPPAAPSIMVSPAPAPSLAPAPTPSAAPSSAPAAAVPSAPARPMATTATSEQQEKALQLLGQATVQGQSVSAPAKPAGKPQAAAKSASKSVQPAATSTPAPAAMPEQPTGPKTKQQRLSELLDLYRADKITPAEYHAQRAKILAEP